MDIESLFDAFIEEIIGCDHILTEDGVRYTFFACMLKQDPDLNHYILELPYQKMNGDKVTIISDTPVIYKGNKGLLELDLFYQADDVAFCFEFKFHRTGDTSSAFANPDAAGGIFNDLKRLQSIRPSCNTCVRKIMVYISDKKMNQYLGQPKKQHAMQDFRIDLKEFYDLPHIGRFIPMTIRARCNYTFRKSALKSFGIIPDNLVTVTGIDLLYKRDNIPINKGCSSFAGTEGAYIRIYEVK